MKGKGGDSKTVWYNECEEEDSLVDESVGLNVGDHVPGRPLAWVPLLRDDDPQLLRLVENGSFYKILVVSPFGNTMIVNGMTLYSIGMIFCVKSICDTGRGNSGIYLMTEPSAAGNPSLMVGQTGK